MGRRFLTMSTMGYSHYGTATALVRKSTTVTMESYSVAGKSCDCYVGYIDYSILMFSFDDVCGRLWCGE
jgi:hypothetical protein